MRGGAREHSCLIGSCAGPTRGRFAVSEIAPAGVTVGGPNAFPNLTVFGGPLGIQQGFTFWVVPEPATVALCAIGVVTLRILRRGKNV